jgi:multiple sugar transport system permease protein
MAVSTTRLAQTAPARKRRRINWVPYAFLAPPLLVYVVWVIWPTFYTFYLSVTNWDGLTTPSYIGFANFRRLLTSDPVFWISLQNNLTWLVIFITLPLALGLALAMILNRNIKGDRLFKVSFYSPMVLSFVVIGLVFSWLYHPRNGLINATLRAFGTPTRDLPGWLADPDLAIYCIIAAAAWRQVGYVMLLYLAGLKNIDPSLLDAAQVDGANGWNLFRRIIFPLLTPVTVIVVVISIIDSLRAFDLVYVMTRGGPANASQVLANFMYIESFNNYKMGYGASIAVILFLISLAFILTYLYRMLQEEREL